MNEPPATPAIEPPPQQRPSGCLLVLLCLVSAVLLIFGGCCIIVSSDFATNTSDWLAFGIPSVLIFVVGLLCARGARRMYKRWRDAKPPA
ncbi:MAG: hypothetical protein JNK67_00545 [Alphaproteobacteria bacterium]|nr:hypothetical protein [Alphaproteobacteria bacterium]